MRTVASPIVVGDLVLGSNGSGGGGNYLVAVRMGKQPQESLSPDTPGTLRVDPRGLGRVGVLYFDRGFVSCMQAADGEIVWSEAADQRFLGFTRVGRRQTVLHRRRWRGAGAGRRSNVSRTRSRTTRRAQPLDARGFRRTHVLAHRVTTVLHRRSVTRLRLSRRGCQFPQRRSFEDRIMFLRSLVIALFVSSPLLGAEPSARSLDTGGFSSLCGAGS